MAKSGIRIRQTDYFSNGQGAAQQAAKTRQEAREARRQSYEGETFSGLNAVQKDALLRDIAIELGLISE